MGDSQCKGCGKPVLFLKDKAGKWQILDPKPPVYRVAKDFTGARYADLDTEAMVSHFATCPQANRFSASSRKETP